MSFNYGLSLIEDAPSRYIEYGINAALLILHVTTSYLRRRLCPYFYCNFPYLPIGPILDLCKYLVLLSSASLPSWSTQFYSEDVVLATREMRTMWPSGNDVAASGKPRATTSERLLSFVSDGLTTILLCTMISTTMLLYYSKSPIRRLAPIAATMI